MKPLCTLVVLVLVVTPSFAEPLFRVRPIDPWAREALERGLSRSPSFRALVATLEESDVIVHIETSGLLPAGISGQMRFATARGGYRYLRVAITSALSLDQRAAVLGHELRHALEVAESHVSNAEEMRVLYTAIGQAAPGPKNTFETEAALEAGEQVWSELHGLRPATRGTANTRAHRQ